MANCEKILISGFSASGKSSLLRAISRKASPDWTNFEDLDDLILKEHKEFPNLATLIKDSGWEQFRIWERLELEKWLKGEGKGVLALGGGTLNPLLWELYKNSSKIKFCYLKTNFEKCWERLNREGEEFRPLLLKGKNELHQIYLERETLFSKIDWQISNDGFQDLSEMSDAFWMEIKSLE